MVYLNKLNSTFKPVHEKLAREANMLKEVKNITPIKEYRGFLLSPQLTEPAVT